MSASSSPSGDFWLSIAWRAAATLWMLIVAAGIRFPCAAEKSGCPSAIGGLPVRIP
jgi:hypothetical protein